MLADKLKIATFIVRVIYGQVYKRWMVIIYIAD